MKETTKKVIFAGAGPGAPDLITMRCCNALKNADIILYAGSLVNPEILKYAKNSCELIDSASLNLEEIVATLKKGAEDGKNVVRLHTGDPSIYGAITEQMNELDKTGIEYEVIPGVSSLFASAAALKTELTLPGISQSIIITRRAGRTPVPDGQNIADFAKHNATMGIFLSISDIEGLVSELISGGYTPETAVAVVYRVSWEDEKIVRGTLEDIAEKVRTSQITRQAMIIVGNAISKQGDKSLLYDATFAHGFRK
jgi:precorrin-4/cobalt-precorrin-4 C11-methyltransferase